MATKPAARRLLRIPEVADILGCSPRHVYRLIADGVFSTVDIGRPGSGSPKSRIPEPDLAAYIGGRTAGAKPVRAGRGATH